jgi:hypothetical protein
MLALHPGVPFQLGESMGGAKVDVIESFEKRLSVAYPLQYLTLTMRKSIRQLSAYGPFDLTQRPARVP